MPGLFRHPPLRMHFMRCSRGTVDWGVIPAMMFFGLGASSILVAAIFLLVLSRMRPIRLGGPQAGSCAR